jgi:Protein kinase domain
MTDKQQRHVLETAVHLHSPGSRTLHAIFSGNVLSSLERTFLLFIYTGTSYIIYSQAENLYSDKGKESRSIGELAEFSNRGREVIMTGEEKAHPRVHFSEPLGEDITFLNRDGSLRKLESLPLNESDSLSPNRVSASKCGTVEQLQWWLPIEDDDYDDINDYDSIGVGYQVYFATPQNDDGKLESSLTLTTRAESLDDLSPRAISLLDDLQHETLPHRNLASSPPTPQKVESLPPMLGVSERADELLLCIENDGINFDGERYHHVHEFEPQQDVQQSERESRPPSVTVERSLKQTNDFHVPESQTLDHELHHRKPESPPPLKILPESDEKDPEETMKPEKIALTSSTRSTSKSCSVEHLKFLSKDLRGNLTRTQINRDPLHYYDVTGLLGVGSMGSVTNVRKRPAAIGGSARKSNLIRVKRENQIKACFNFPVFGGLFQYCLEGEAEAYLEKSMSSPSTSHVAGTEASPSTQMTFAMKSILLSRCTVSAYVEELKNEVEILKTLDHPHIVRAIETFEIRNQLFVIMELCSGGDLYSRDPYTEEEAARITASILRAISYMHSRGM